MRIRIVHETRYRYENVARGILQMLRLTPRSHEGQHVAAWRIETSAEGRLRVDEDGLGNVVHIFAADEPVEEIFLKVAGEVEMTDTAGLMRGTVERVPAMFFLRDTDLTAGDPAILDFARSAAADRTGLDMLHGLLGSLHDRIVFDPSPTNSNTTAVEAFGLGRGVCQDMTHIFISAARHLGVPARYVSGYFSRSDGVTAQEAGHAWAEAWVDDLGWVGFDATNGICTTDAHVRVAIGLDYLGAAPIRGSRRGGGSESLGVRLTVEPAQTQAQTQTQTQN